MFPTYPFHFFQGRDGLPAKCYLFYSPSDMWKTKRLIEWKRGADLSVTKKNLGELSELNRVLSSRKLCLRQSVLSLMDEPSPQRCVPTESQCDICLGQNEPVIRNVTNEVRLVLGFLGCHSDIHVFTLRSILAGLNHTLPSENVSDIEGLLKSWPVDEIAQFTDFLLNGNFMQKKAILVDDVPSYCLIPKPASISDEEIFISVYEVVPIPSSLKKRTFRSRHHDISKRRFYPKGAHKS